MTDDHSSFVIRHLSLGNWLRVLQETYGFEASTIEGLPLMEVSSPITGRRGISLPFTDEVFVASARTSSLDIGHWPLFAGALAYGRSRNWKYLELRGSAAELVNMDVNPCSSGSRPSVSFHGHALDLTPGENTLFDRLESSVARAVRKAQKAGVEIEISDTEVAVRQYYSLHCLTRRKHGLPPQPWKFFAKIHKHMIGEGQGIIVLAKLDKTSIAGAVFLHSDPNPNRNHTPPSLPSLPSVGNRGQAEQLTTNSGPSTLNHQPSTQLEALYKFGASDERFQSFRPNNLVMWEAIKYYAARRFTTLRFGRTDLGHAGLRRFKLSFGTAEYPIHHWRYDLRRECFVTCPTNIAGWHNHLFRAMPVAASRVLGTLLYRHIA